MNFCDISRLGATRPALANGMTTQGTDHEVRRAQQAQGQGHQREIGRFHGPGGIPGHRSRQDGCGYDHRVRREAGPQAWRRNSGLHQSHSRYAREGIHLPEPPQVREGEVLLPAVHTSSIPRRAQIKTLAPWLWSRASGRAAHRSWPAPGCPKPCRQRPALRRLRRCPARC
jgi:hypothetical protein